MYKKAEFELVEFEVEDVILTSGDEISPEDEEGEPGLLPSDK